MQLTLISHSCGGWKFKVKVTTDSVSGESLLRSLKAIFSLCLTWYEEVKGLPGVSIISTLILFMSVLPSRSDNLRRPHLLTPPHMGLGFQRVNFCRDTDTSMVHSHVRSKSLSPIFDMKVLSSFSKNPVRTVQQESAPTHPCCLTVHALVPSLCSLANLPLIPVHMWSQSPFDAATVSPQWKQF